MQDLGLRRRRTLNGGLSGDHPNDSWTALFNTEQRELIAQFRIAEKKTLQISHWPGLAAIGLMTKTAAKGGLDHPASKLLRRRKPHLVLKTKGIGLARQFRKAPQASLILGSAPEGLTFGRKLCRAKNASTSANCLSACSRSGKGALHRACRIFSAKSFLFMVHQKDTPILRITKRHARSNPLQIRSRPNRPGKPPTSAPRRERAGNAPAGLGLTLSRLIVKTHRSQ